MYSAVLMLALTAGSETADFGRNRCSCTTSCTTTVVASCSRAYSCSSSCSKSHRLFGNRCHGCSTSCTTAVVAAPACSTSCSSSCHARKKLFGGHRCSSTCTVIYGCSTGCSTGTVVVPAKKAMPNTGEKVPAPKKGAVSLSVPATIVVSLPAGANLIVDGTPTTSTSERRTFVTPELETGVTYVYNMRAELVRDGRTVVQTQDVTVRGGETSTVQFQFSNQGVASR